MKKLLKVCFLLLAVVLSGCATTGTSVLKTDAPLPPDVAIVPPGPEIPPKLAALSGSWFGRWDGQMDHLLIVERIESPEKIIAVYSYGAGFGRRHGWSRVMGKFTEIELQFFGGGTVPFATYEVRGNTLRGVYRLGKVYSEATMKRVDLNLISK